MKTHSSRSTLFAFLSLLFAILACNSPVSPPFPSPETEINLATYTSLPPTNTPGPTATPAPTVTPTPRGPLTLLTVPQIGPLTRFGRGTIQDLAIHPAGKILAVATPLGIWFYDLETLTLIQTLDDPLRNLTHLTWSPDGNFLAYSENAGPIFLWDESNQTLSQTLLETSATVSALTWAPNSQQLATADEDGIVQIWDITNGEILKSIEGYFEFGGSVAWSPDGTSLAFSGYTTQDYTSTLWLWNLTSDHITELFKIDGTIDHIQWAATGNHLAVFWAEPCMGGSCDSVFLFEMTNGKASDPSYFSSASFAFSPDGSQLALDQYGGKIDLLELSKGEVSDTLDEKTKTPSRFAKHLLWTPDGQHLITVSDTNEIRLWDLTTQEVTQKMSEHTQVAGATWSPTQNVLAYKTRNEVHLWDVVTNETMLVIPHEQAVESFSFAPDGQQLATYIGEFPQILNVFEIASSTVVRSWEEASYGWADHITWASDGRLIAGSGTSVGGEYYHGGVLVWDAMSGDLKGSFLAAFSWHVWSPDGRMLAILEQDKVHLWDAVRHEESLILHATDGIDAAAWSPDGTKLAVGDDNGILTIWDTATLTVLHQLEHRPETGLEALAWSPDGAFLASAGFDDTVQVWDMAQGTLSASLTGHVQSVRALAWFQDGTFLVTGDTQGTLRFFQLPDGQLLHTQTGHTTPIAQISFAPDGSLLATQARDGTVLLWGFAEHP